METLSRMQPLWTQFPAISNALVSCSQCGPTPWTEAFHTQPFEPLHDLFQVMQAQSLSKILEFLLRDKWSLLRLECANICLAHRAVEIENAASKQKGEEYQTQKTLFGTKTLTSQTGLVNTEEPAPANAANPKDLREVGGSFSSVETQFFNEE